eukprot:1099158-Alexandrium_andersonii.AAC.1
MGCWLLATEKLAALSLFDGVGVAWHVVDEFLTLHQLRDRLAAAWLVEQQDHLADAVVRWRCQ